MQIFEKFDENFGKMLKKFEGKGEYKLLKYFRKEPLLNFCKIQDFKKKC